LLKKSFLESKRPLESTPIKETDLNRKYPVSPMASDEATDEAPYQESTDDETDVQGVESSAKTPKAAKTSASGSSLIGGSALGGESSSASSGRASSSQAKSNHNLQGSGDNAHHESEGRTLGLSAILKRKVDPLDHEDKRTKGNEEDGEDPFFDHSSTSRHRLMLKVATILPSTPNDVILEAMTNALSKVDMSERRKDSCFVSEILDIVESRPNGDTQSGVNILKKDLPKNCEWIINHFEDLREIFKTRTPEAIAAQIIQVVGKFPFDETKGVESYYSLIIDNLCEESSQRPASSPSQCVGYASAAPSAWLEMASANLLTPVEENSEEFKRIAAEWNIFCPIERIERVQNWALWRLYQTRREVIKEKVGAANLNEKNLWHGSATDTVKIIIEQGFDSRVGVKNGRAWGNGVYLASHASFAFNYASSIDYAQRMRQYMAEQYENQNVALPTHMKIIKTAAKKRSKKTDTYVDHCDHDNELKCMIYSKAICGRSTVGKQGIFRPPLLDPKDPTRGLYDSCTDQTGEIFVFFENFQLYPEYIVYFKETDPFKNDFVKTSDR